jgi:acetyl esterase/lipase
MKFIFPALVSSLVFVHCAIAADRQVIELWPNGAPGEEVKLEPEHDTTKDSDGKVGGQGVIRLGNVSKPTITIYPAPKENATGAAVLVCPGGAYHILAMDLEGTEVCERLNSMGVTAILLKYRVPKRPNQEKHAPALQDAQRAMGLIRQNWEKWEIDQKRLGVLGFSAGGHLAAVLSNEYEKRNYTRLDGADELSCKPDFTILIYPAYLATEPNRTKLATEINITKETPQAFIAMAQDDPVHVENALVYAATLQAWKIPFELHIYPTGGHGYGLRRTGERVTSWPDRLQEWLVSRGIVKKKILEDF